MAEGVKVVATNRKAGFEYFLLDRFEAGLSLGGSEIKSIRAGQMSSRAYVDVENGRSAWLLECHIAPYAQASRFNPDPGAAEAAPSQAAAPRVVERRPHEGDHRHPCLFKGGRAKIEIALLGKKAYDKRAVIAIARPRRDCAGRRWHAARRGELRCGFAQVQSYLLNGNLR
jgi:SsrA-binding protein